MSYTALEEAWAGTPQQEVPSYMGCDPCFCSGFLLPYQERASSQPGRGQGSRGKNRRQYQLVGTQTNCGYFGASIHTLMHSHGV